MFHIGVLQFTIDIPYAASLKEKRRVVKSMKDRIRRSFNVSVAEVDHLDEYTVATLSVVMASTDIPYLNSSLDRLLNLVHDSRDASLADHQLEIISPTS